MIHVERPPEPAVLGRRKTRGRHKGKNEREAVEAAFGSHVQAGRDPETFKFDFAVYKDDEVKSALETAFEGKCAYCETFYSASQPMDVEHWRPKGEIHTDEEEASVLKPGYYWLASDWDNLFPSCIDCNRARRQVDVVERRPILLGKANQFPLADEATRVRSHEQSTSLDGEDVLLVDPCSDHPETFFAYTEEGVILPREGLDGEDRKRALASIRVYALNRSALVAERLEVIHRLDHRFRLIDQLADLRQKLTERREHDLAEVVAELILAESRSLDKMMQASSPFAGLARYLIRRARPPSGE